MMLPWITSGKLRDSIESLLKGMQKYVSFLNGMKSRTKANQNKAEPVRNLQDNWLLNTIERETGVVKSE
ncbi:hypothetical protein DPMN_148357 [Dreissena polymorpha]|uniref:Uncharacterized protein n=1 Tax=Dreissena polymorpha TaxID=45954 RepID=A0A9D4FCC1_DREPO|nr:hypothetical protein DPMN_148357 [Dreissena polymorpha]